MIFTHSDLDGLSSALIALAISGQSSEDVYTFSYEPNRDEQWQKLITMKLKPSEYSSVETKLPDIWFVDISLRPGELEWARNQPHDGKWFWVDHHVSSLEFNSKGIFDEILLDTSGEKCAADILWDFHRLSPGFFNSSNLYPWVEVAHDRDLWINKNRERNMKLDMIFKDIIYKGALTSFLRLCQRRIPEQLIFHMKSTWEYGMKAMEDSCKVAQSTRQLYISNDYHFIIAWIKGQASDVADTLYENGDEIIAMLQLFEDNVALNLRTRRKDIDLSMIAKAFGGGGHRQAAGGKLTKRHLSGGFDVIINDLADAVHNV